MATIYEVAKLAGVSLSTVSRVLNGHKTVNETLKAKVDSAVRELNYRPSSVARSLATNRSDSVGILVSELNTPFFGEMMRAIEMTLRASNKHVIITVGHNDEEQEKDGVEFLVSRNCDAIIMHVEGLGDDTIRHINDTKIPVALVNREIAGLDDACMTLNNENGGYLCTRHLIDQGHTSIAYIAGPKAKHDANERLAGHKRALHEAGLTNDEGLFYQGDFTEFGGINGLTTLLQRDIPFSALVCANDWMASGAITCARDKGLSLPEQLSIVGFDDMLFAHHVFPKLTTVNNPIYQMGEMAARYILNKVYGEKQPVTNLFEPELIVRDSAVPL